MTDDSHLADIQLADFQSKDASRIRHQLIECKKASRQMALSSTEQRDQLLLTMANLLRENTKLLLSSNQQDLAQAKAQGLSDAMIDRLTLDSNRIEAIAVALEQVSQLPDPLLRKTEARTLANGLKVRKQPIPLGVILMVFESRPNVTVDAAALALKAGNAIVLRGGKEAFFSNQAIAQLWRRALHANDLNTSAVIVLDTTERALLDDMLRWDDLIDLVIPRGGEGLIRYVVETSRIPVIKHYKGVCHLFVDRDADQEKAIDILLNGKVQRPGVCNALETLLIDESIAKSFLPKAVQALSQVQVEVRGCNKCKQIVSDVVAATDDDFAAEFLDLIISVKIVKDVNEAIDHIAQYGSLHTEVIVSENPQTCAQFIREVDASVVMENASSRFSDGGELGLGAEIGISTSKLHAFGPMGLEALTSERFVVSGSGQVRS